MSFRPRMLLHLEYFQGIWNLLANQKKSRLASEVEDKVTSAAVGAAAAFSIAMAAAAAAKVAVNGALQARLMADEALVSVIIGNPVQRNEPFHSVGANNEGNNNPARTLLLIVICLFPVHKSLRNLT